MLVDRQRKQQAPRAPPHLQQQRYGRDANSTALPPAPPGNNCMPSIPGRHLPTARQPRQNAAHMRLLPENNTENVSPPPERVQVQGGTGRASKKLRKGGASNSTLRMTTRTFPKDKHHGHTNNTLASATCSPGPRPSPPSPRFKSRTIYNSALSTTDINRFPALYKPKDNYTLVQTTATAPRARGHGMCVDSCTTKAVSKQTTAPNCYLAPPLSRQAQEMRGCN